MYRGLKYNGSGCIDLTAYQAIINITRDSLTKNTRQESRDASYKNRENRKGDNYEHCKNDKYRHTHGYAK